ncbi:MAG TPA: hypothetical protein VLG44_00040, partial [Chlamydiales bacterium]|nr:hypothetical protein [Chlamydiales bacterium]
MTAPVTNPITPPASPETDVPGDGAIKSGAKRTPKQPDPPEQPREFVSLLSVCMKEVRAIDHRTWWGTAKKISAIVFGIGLFALPFSFLFEPFHALIHYGLKSKSCCTPLNPEKKKQSSDKSKKETDKSDKSKTDQEKTKTKKRHRGTLPELDGIPPPPLPEPKKAVEKSEDDTKTKDTSELSEEDLQKKIQEEQEKQMQEALKPVASTIGCTEKDLLEFGKMYQESLMSMKERAIDLAVWAASSYDPTGYLVSACDLVRLGLFARKIPNRKLSLAYAATSLTVKHVLLGYFGYTGTLGLAALGFAGYKIDLHHPKKSPVKKIAAVAGAGITGYGAMTALQYISPWACGYFGATGTLGLGVVAYGGYKAYQAGVIGELYQAAKEKIRAKLG